MIEIKYLIFYYEYSVSIDTRIISNNGVGLNFVPFIRKIKRDGIFLFGGGNNDNLAAYRIMKVKGTTKNL